VIRALLLRYVLPAAAAVGLVAFVGVPYIDHVLTGWFRADLQQRARLVMTSMEGPLAALLDSNDQKRAQTYLSHVAGDERLLGIVVCAHSGEPVLQTPLAPTLNACSALSAGEQGASTVVHSAAGLVQISHFSLITRSGQPYAVLIAHNLGYIDRRQTNARNLMLAFIVIAAAALAILGHDDIHQMNGLKNVLALLINAVAAAYFVAAGMVIAGDAVVMAVGATIGGVASAGLARRMGRKAVRRAVIVVGFAMTVALFLRL